MTKTCRGTHCWTAVDVEEVGLRVRCVVGVCNVSRCFVTLADASHELRGLRVGDVYCCHQRY